VRRLTTFAGVASIVVVLGGSITPAQASDQPRLPGSIAAIGDSMTRAADVCCWYGDHPGQSWSTGGAGYDPISSHYERILKWKPGVHGHNYNDAVSGARMSDAERQAEAAVSQQAKYVTILMGANDLCTSSAATMTPTETFRSQFESAMTTLETGLPVRAHIFVASIPNIYRLWEVYHDSWFARLVWSSANICQSMLAAGNTEADRQVVLAHERELNDVLAEVCGRYSNCRFDGYAVFNHPFTRDQVSTLDYFHPDLDGQAVLAEITWANSWWSAL
jgi:lysophospholipase L1-like esterase